MGVKTTLTEIKNRLDAAYKFVVQENEDGTVSYGVTDRFGTAPIGSVGLGPSHAAEHAAMQASGTYNSPYILASTGIPIGIPPGNGSTVGLQFTNTTGAFSLTTTTFTNTYALGIWLWMPIGAFDGTNPTIAGLYWAVMSSGSAGQLYTATYRSTIPTGLVQATTTASRWLTQTTAQVSLVSVPLAANTLGLNGSLMFRHVWSCFNSAGTKTLQLLIDTGVAVAILAPTTNGGWNGICSITNRGAANKQVGSGTGSGGQGFSSMTGNAAQFSVDTTALINPGATGQLAVNTDFLILESLQIQVLPF